MTTLSLEKITKSYAQTPVLLDVNIDVNSGEFLVLLGPSGCGKSTLLHAIAGLHSITSGDIVIDGKRVNDVPCQDRDIAMVFQSYALYPSMTVAQNIGFPLEMRKVGATQREKAVMEVARLLRIDHLLNRKPGQLSGGQRQRVALAEGRRQRGLYAGRVEGILLEEPRGAGGFGYDPLFYYPPFGCTFGEATEEQKFEVSHRGQAFRSMLARLF